MSLIVKLEQESTKDKPVAIEVYACRGDGTVSLTLPPPDTQYPDCARILDADEARALAAALNHYADEAER